MVAHAALPLAKLGALVLKQVSKPIANFVKAQAKSHPVFRRYVCLPPAKLYNWCEVKLKMWMLRFGTPVQITVLNEQAFIDLGAELLGEGVIFTIAAAILINEYSRSVRKETAKEEAKKLEMEALQHTIKDLFVQLETQGAQIRELNRRLNEIDSPKLSSWFGKKHEEPTDDPPQKEPPKKRPEDRAVAPEDEILLPGNMDTYTAHYDVTSGIVLKAIGHFQQQFTYKTETSRQPGVLTVALNFLYRDVYRQSERF